MAATRTSRKPATAAPKQPSRVTKTAAPKTTGKTTAPKATGKTAAPKAAGKSPQKAGPAVTAAASRPRRTARLTRAAKASLPKEAFQVGGGPVDLSDEGIEKRKALFTQWEAHYAAEGEAAYPYLTMTPPATHRYINQKTGQFALKDDRFVAKVYSPPAHPKITEAEKKGTLTRAKTLYYVGVNRTILVPFAGIPKPEGAARRLKPINLAQAKDAVANHDDAGPGDAGLAETNMKDTPNEDAHMEDTDP